MAWQKQTSVLRQYAHAQRLWWKEMCDRGDGEVRRPSLEAVEKQLDELELLESVFSQPGEFSADRVAIETAAAWTRGLTTEAPVARLSCNLRLSVDRHHPTAADSEEEEEDGSRDGSVEAAACCGAEQCILDISMTLPHR